MGKLSIEHITPGMRLAADLRGANGRFLLPRGVEIQDKHLRIMKIWGVNEAEVEGGPASDKREDAPDALPPELMGQALMLLETLFRLSNPTYPPVRVLKQLSLQKLIDHIRQNKPLLLPGKPSGRPLTLPKERPESAMALAGQEVQLVSFPDIYFQIMEVLNDPGSTASHVAEVVGRDSSLTMKLLRLVNSPFYGFPSKVDSITRAVALVGSNELSMLALGISVVQYFEHVPPELMDMRHFWMHSIACGVFARILASHKPGLSEERFFLGGLIHDVGRLVILKCAPESAAASLLLTRDKPCMLYEAEQAVLGFDHSEVASRLMRLWQFPETLEDMVAFHHNPAAATSVLDAAIIHIADIMASSMWTGYKGLFYVPPLEPAAWEALELSPSILAPALSKGEHLILDIYNTFSGRD